jgi:hypothetical protein
MKAGRKPLLTIEQRQRIVNTMAAKREVASAEGHSARWKSFPTLDELASWYGVSRDTVKLIAMQKRDYVRVNPLDEMAAEAAA